MKTISFYPELSTDERIKQLKKVCKSKTVKVFKRSLTESDIEKELRVYADLGIKLQDAEAEKSEVVKLHNEGIKAIEAEQNVSLDVIKNGKKEVSDDLWSVPNYNTGQMETFDKFGELIETRGLTPDEHTGHLFDNDGDTAKEMDATAAEDNGVKSIGFDGNNDNVQDADFEEIPNEDLPTSETSTDETDKDVLNKLGDKDEPVK